MVGLIESAGAILSASERRLEVIAQNTANVATPGYQRRVSFETLVANRQSSSGLPFLSTVVDTRSGQLVSTGNPLDIAIAGEGTFIVRDGERLIASRGGSFRRDEDGRMIDSLGRALQQSGGGDVVVDSDVVSIGVDGTVLVGGQPTAKIGVFAVDARIIQSAEVDGLSHSAMDEEVADPQIRQAMVEQSNVVLGDEMVAMMATARSAEGGARIVHIYDELIGRVFTNLGQAGR